MHYFPMFPKFLLMFYIYPGIIYSDLCHLPSLRNKYTGLFSLDFILVQKISTLYLLEMYFNRKEFIFQEKQQVGNLRIRILPHILTADLACAVITEVSLQGFCTTFRHHSRWERLVRNCCRVPKARSLSDSVSDQAACQ